MISPSPSRLTKFARFLHYAFQRQVCVEVCHVSAVLWFSTLLSAQPVVKLSPTSLSFGNQMVGVSSSAQGITLTNTGTTSLSLSDIKVSGGNRLD